MGMQQGCGATGSPTAWARVWVETGIAWNYYAREEKLVLWYNAKAESLWVAEAVATKRFFEKFISSLAMCLKQREVHMDNAQADFCTLLFLGRMLIIAKGFEEDGTSITGSSCVLVILCWY